MPLVDREIGIALKKYIEPLIKELTPIIKEIAVEAAKAYVRAEAEKLRNKNNRP